MCDCPKCGWRPPEVPFYYCKKGKAIDCTRTVREDYNKPPEPVKEEINPKDIFSFVELMDGPKVGSLFGKPPFKHFKCYPIIENYHSSMHASYEFGIDGHNWIETHRCPACKKEFSLDNSDY